MIKRLSIIVTFMSITSASCFADGPSIGNKFRAIFPNTSIDEVNKTPVNGVYEVLAGGNVVYFAPDSGHVFFGQLWDSKGRNLTADLKPKLDSIKQRRQKVFISELVSVEALAKAVRIGNGPRVVVEFTDPDCPYCRRMDGYWSKRDDVSRYVFFSPLPMHPKAPAKAEYILGAGDKPKAYRDVYDGKYDSVPPPKPGSDVTGIMEYHRDLTVKSGINGTPAYYIDGVFVSGADVDAVDKLLGKGGVNNE